METLGRGGREGDRYLAAALAGGGEPLELAVVMDKADAATAGTGVAQGALRLGGVAADAALLLLFLRPRSRPSPSSAELPRRRPSVELVAEPGLE